MNIAYTTTYKFPLKVGVTVWNRLRRLAVLNTKAYNFAVGIVQKSNDQYCTNKLTAYFNWLLSKDDEFVFNDLVEKQAFEFKRSEVKKDIIDKIVSKEIDLKRCIRNDLAMLQQNDFFNKLRDGSFLNKIFCYGWLLKNIKKNDDIDFASVKIPSYVEMNRMLTIFKQNNPEMYEVPSHSLQKNLSDVDDSVRSFFKKNEQGEKASFPHTLPDYCNRRIFLPGTRFSICNEHGFTYLVAPLPKIDLNPKNDLKIRILNKDTKIEGTLRNVSIFKKPRGKFWFVSIQTVVTKDIVPITEGKDVGIDLGASGSHSNNIVVGDGELEVARYNLPQAIDIIDEKIERLQRIKNSILEKNGHNYKSRQVDKFSAKIAKLHQKKQNIRDNFIHHSTKEISSTHPNVYMEDIKVKEMTNSASGSIENTGVGVKIKSKLNKKILNVGFYKIRETTKYKCHRYGSNLFTYNPAYSSQKCSHCGYIDEKNRNGNVFCCLKCGHTSDADLNAANNHVNTGRDIATKETIKKYSGFRYKKNKDKLPVSVL